MYIKRLLTPFIKKLLDQFPAVLISGARQSGKSTLLQKNFPDYTYVTLDDLQSRDMAKTDPKLFLDFYKTPVIIDEIQNAPDLLSYIKIQIDENRKKKGQYIMPILMFLLLDSNKEALWSLILMATMWNWNFG